jgi:NTE family protein
VVDNYPRLDTLAFQIDRWLARGDVPGDVTEVATRQKEIQYCNRTRDGMDSFKNIQWLRRATADLLEQLPEHLRNGPRRALVRKAKKRGVLFSSCCRRRLFARKHIDEAPYRAGLNLLE